MLFDPQPTEMSFSCFYSVLGGNFVTILLGRGASSQREQSRASPCLPVLMHSILLLLQRRRCFRSSQVKARSEIDFLLGKCYFFSAVTLRRNAGRLTRDVLRHVAGIVAARRVDHHQGFANVWPQSRTAVICVFCEGKNLHNGGAGRPLEEGRAA